MSEENSNTSTMLIALVVAVVFMIALPATFYLVKGFPQQQQPAAPVPSSPAPQASPPVIVAPANYYHQGWEDAAHCRPPSCHDHEYRRGYHDFCHQHPHQHHHPDFQFRINID